MVLVLLSLRLSVFSTVMSTPERSLLFGRRVMGPPKLQLVPGCVPAEKGWETRSCRAGCKQGRVQDGAKLDLVSLGPAVSAPASTLCCAAPKGPGNREGVGAAACVETACESAGKRADPWLNRSSKHSLDHLSSFSGVGHSAPGTLASPRPKAFIHCQLRSKS